MSKEQHIKSYIVEGGTAEETAALFQSAADLHQLSPGELLSDIPLMLEVPSLGIKGACLLWMQEEEALEALFLFPSLEAYQSAIQSGDAVDAPNLLALLYQDKTDISVALRREVKRHDWAISDERYPRILCTDYASQQQDPDPKAYLILQLCCEALSLLVTMYSHSLRKAQSSPFTLQFSSKQKDDESHAVSLSCPYPTTKLSPSSRQESWQEQLISAFFRAEPKIGQEGLSLLATHLLLEVLEFKSVYRGEAPLDWSADDVSDFCLSYFPYRVMASDELIQATPAILQYFFSWVASIGQIKDARPILRHLQTQKRLFMQRAQDPRFFGEAKVATIKLFRADLA